ncbi:Uncharacterised protein [Mycobacteroides abscessus subsp. abscessus]|nr:Uncharacterised protein [Mycobacteroides abscessus subsp. abscessus]
MTSGGSLRMDSVARSSSSSSMSGMMRMAGAWMTSAPRRVSSAANSSARRAAVMPMVKPVRVLSGFAVTVGGSEGVIGCRWSR